MAAPQEGAKAVYFIGNVSHITGEVIVVDGYSELFRVIIFLIVSLFVFLC
jgi:hypothetical protein